MKVAARGKMATGMCMARERRGALIGQCRLINIPIGGHVARIHDGIHYAARYRGQHRQIIRLRSPPAQMAENVDNRVSQSAKEARGDAERRASVAMSPSALFAVVIDTNKIELARGKLAGITLHLAK